MLLARTGTSAGASFGAAFPFVIFLLSSAYLTLTPLGLQLRPARLHAQLHPVPPMGREAFLPSWMRYGGESGSPLAHTGQLQDLYETELTPSRHLPATADTADPNTLHTPAPRRRPTAVPCLPTLSTTESQFPSPACLPVPSILPTIMVADCPV